MAEWYYGREGQQYGPIDEAALRVRIATSEIRADDLIWREGMAEWAPLNKISQFNAKQAPLTEQDESPVQDFFSTNPGSPYAPPAANPVGSGAAIGGVQMAPPTSGLAIASMVCGILSLFLCFCWGGIIGIPAVICGHMAMGQTGSQDPGQPPRMGGREMAIAGLIMGYLGIMTFVILFVGKLSVVALQ